MNINLGLNMVSESTRRRGRQNDPDRTTPAGYAAVYPTPETVRFVMSELEKIGLKTDFDPKDLHVTMMYDRENPVLFHPAAPIQIEATVNSAALFGHEENTLVLKLDSQGLIARHKYLRQMGYRHSYPEYEPHMTIKVPADQLDLDLLNQGLSAGAFSGVRLVFGGETWEPIREDAYAKYEDSEDKNVEGDE